MCPVRIRDPIIKKGEVYIGAEADSGTVFKYIKYIVPMKPMRVVASQSLKMQDFLQIDDSL